MQPKFEGIDFEANPTVGAEMKKHICSTAEKIFGTALGKEQLEVLVLCLSKRYGGNMKNIKLEVTETFGEDSDEKNIASLLQWIEKELPQLYAEALPEKYSSDGQKTSETLLEKREKSGSILDRVVTRGDTPVPPAASPTPAEQSDEATAKKGKREPSRTRCVHWPACKNPECPFVHPKENVISIVSKVSFLSFRQQMFVHSSGSKYRS